ncbi:17-beta-hydroxysteroid dehydrogenase type 2 [Mastacembelus armatus]|uniref:Hydroxysteroid (17-beta) dehydrogenase 2 n=1 Tax=Mastacembelus armatus TaxID=205130 RepID=A0A3Q3M8V2_9TELE|nr:estradiol 17-beta-dehydrogenase 2 [Mastacembelus armatus]
METCSWVCVVTAAIFTVTLLWKRSSGYWFWGLGTLIGASLYFIACPGVYVGVVLTCCLTLICGTERSQKLLPGPGRAVLVTGCDSGFGHSLAKLLSDRGVKVFAGVLDVNGAGAQQLRERGCENLQVLQLDVTDGAQVERVRLHVSSQVGATGLWGLVNNAGILHCPVDAELHLISVYRLCLEVNFLAAVNMCQVFLPLLRRSKGRIVNVSSLAGEVPVPMFAAYGASKAALTRFSTVLRMEMSAWGVRVALIQPSGFRTNIFANTDIGRYRQEVLATVSPETREDYGEAYISSLASCLAKTSQQLPEDVSPVVDDMCHALLAVHPRPLYTPGQMSWMLPFLHRCCPTAVFDSIVRRLPQYTDREPAGLKRS